LDNPSKSVTEIMFKGELCLLHPFALLLPPPLYVIIPFLYSQPTAPLIYSNFSSLHGTLFSCIFLSIFPFSLHIPPLIEVIHLPSFFLRLIYLPLFFPLPLIHLPFCLHLSSILLPFSPPFIHLPPFFPHLSFVFLPSSPTFLSSSSLLPLLSAVFPPFSSASLHLPSFLLSLTSIFLPSSLVSHPSPLPLPASLIHSSLSATSLPSSSPSSSTSLPSWSFFSSTSLPSSSPSPSTSLHLPLFTR